MTSTSNLVPRVSPPGGGKMKDPRNVQLGASMHCNSPLDRSLIQLPTPPSPSVHNSHENCDIAPTIPKHSFHQMKKATTINRGNVWFLYIIIIIIVHVVNIEGVKKLFNFHVEVFQKSHNPLTETVTLNTTDYYENTNLQPTTTFTADS